MKITINSGAFAGITGELLERGEFTSRAKLVIFGRETIIELENNQFAMPGEAFDPFESFAAQIRMDRRWEHGEALREWWLAIDDPDADTWSEYLAKKDEIEETIDRETAELLEHLKAGVSADADHAEINVHFAENDHEFRAYRMKFRTENPDLNEEATERAEARAREVAMRERIAFRAWWHEEPRETEGCKEFLEEVWASKDFSRMVDAELEAFDRWGLEAINLIENRYRDEPIEVRELDELPDEHVWKRLAILDPGAAVRQVFEPLSAELPRLIEALSFAVRAIYFVELADVPYLVYACDAEEGYGENRIDRLSLITGGPPLDDAALAGLDEKLSGYVRSCGWSVPDDLRRFYRVHHGLGRIASWAKTFDNAGSIYPVDQLGVVGEYMNEIAADQDFEPEGYRFDDLLAFWEDGAGNCQNFFRREPDQAPVGTVDWDHETREVSGVDSFWQFVERSPMQWWFGES